MERPIEVKNLDSSFIDLSSNLGSVPHLSFLIRKFRTCLESRCFNFLIYKMLEPEARKSIWRLLEDSRESMHLVRDKMAGRQWIDFRLSIGSFGIDKIRCEVFRKERGVSKITPKLLV